MVGHYVFIITWNREDSLVITTQELTEDIFALFLLISTDAHIGVNHYGIHDAKDNYDVGATIYDIHDSESVSC